MGFAHREAAGVCAEVVWWFAFQERYVVVGVDDVVGGEVDAFGVEVAVEVSRNGL